MCERDPEKPYTRETFQMTRAEVFDPRIHPLDVRAIQNLLAVAYHRVCDAAIQAYRAKEVTYFNYALREFMETVEQRWPDSRELPISMDVAETASNSAVLLEKARSEKLPPN